MASFTGAAQTSGTADTGILEIEATLSTGTATGLVLANLVLHHQKGASGFGGTATGPQVLLASGASVNVTGTSFGISVNPGTAATWTFGPVIAEASNTI
jgi:allophanate hydrolase subunit 2